MPQSSDCLAVDARFNELAEILSAAIVRVRSRHSTPKGSRRDPVSVDFSPKGRGHGAPSRKRRKRHGRT